MLKEKRSGSRSAWFHTVSDKGFAAAAAGSINNNNNSEVGGGESEEEVLSEEKPARLQQRRQRSLMSGGGGNTPGDGVLGSPDLLTIPGVGPRNLRKLVKNGIRGVAELKQIYKDKVDFLFLNVEPEV